MTSPIIRTLTELHRDDCACPRCLPNALVVERSPVATDCHYMMLSDDEPAPDGWHRVARWER